MNCFFNAHMLGAALTAPSNPVMLRPVMASEPLSLLKIAVLVPLGTVPPVMTTVAALVEVELS